MTFLALTGLAALLPILLFLACPLIMVFLMRGMHGGHGHGSQMRPDQKLRREQMTLDELKRERDELNDLIGRRAEQTADEKRRAAFR
jgi:Protein of unknown function (DUF2933)